jgi:hypothetical protein
MLHRTLTLALAIACLLLTVALVWHGKKLPVDAPMPAALAAEGANLLKRPVGDVKWDNVTFAEAVNRLSDISGANICAEWRTLEGIGIGRETRVSLHLANATLGEALHALVRAVPGNAKEAAVVCAADGIITITDTDAALKHPVMEYLNIRPLIDALAGPNADADVPGDSGFRATIAEEIEVLIKTYVAPDSWYPGGTGPATIEHVAGILVVAQTPENLREIRRVLAGFAQAARHTDVFAATGPADAATRPAEFVAPGLFDDSAPLFTAFINIRPLLDAMAANEGAPDPSRPISTAERVERIDRMLRDLVAPGTWRDEGGTLGSIRELGAILIVTQSKENLASVRDVLQRLHRALHAADFSGQSGASPAIPPSGTPAATQPVLELIDVSPLLALMNRKAAASSPVTTTDDVVNLIVANIDPGSWRDESKTATIVPHGGILAITQTPANQLAIRQFLDQLHRKATTTIAPVIERP